MKRLSIFLVLFLVVASQSCKKKTTLSGTSMEQAGDYIAGYTSGFVSRKNPILVRFVHALGSESGQEAPKDFLEIRPSVKGRLYWKDTHTLAFEPEDMFEPDKAYHVVVKLRKIIPAVPSNLSVVTFDFHTLPLEASLKVEPVRIDEKNGEVIEGEVALSDYEKPETVEKQLKVTGIAQPSIVWAHNLNAHRFTVSNIQRTTQPQEVKVTWNGRPLGLERLTQTVAVPPEGKFKIVTAKISNTGLRPAVRIYFSDRLKKNQNFQGLVSIAGYTGSLTFWPEGSVLNVNVNGQITGKNKVVVHPGILNARGQKLTGESEFLLEFGSLRPQVRLVGNGVILPRSSGKAYFPFDAVGLRYVDVEIFKIFSNNILQFLQINEPDGGAELERVGRIIAQKRVPLTALNPDANTSVWTRYALDLSEIFDQSPNAIYQVRIAFRPEYRSMTCGDEETLPELPLTPVHSEGEDYKSIMGDYYSYDGYFSGYDWSLRDDPCAKEYYNTDRFISRNIYLSDFGIIAKQGEANEIFATVFDLTTAKPKAGVDLEFFDYQQQSLLTSKTDDGGQFHSTLPREPFFIKAKKGDQVGYLRMEPAQSLSVSRFDVGGQSVEKGTKGYLYAERDVWRPGDSVYLNFVMVKNEEIAGEYPVTLTLYDARGRQYLEKTALKNSFGLYDLRFATTPDAPTGYWRAIVKAGGAEFAKNIHIETIKPNRLKIIADLPEKLNQSEVNRTTTLQINYLHGAPASGVEVSVKRKLKRAKTSFPNYLDYEFTDPVLPKNFDQVEVFKGQTDNSGQVKFFDKINATRLPGKMKLSYSIRATERGGDFSTAHVSALWSPYATYTGLLLKEEYGYKKLNIDEANKVKAVTLTDAGKPVSGHKLNLTLYRLSWSWWWDANDDFVSNFNNADYAAAIDSVTLFTNSKGQITWEVSPPDWGRYLIRVVDPQNGQSAGIVAYAGSPWNEKPNRAQMQAAAMLPMKTDKSTYNTGDEVVVKIPGGQEGRALVTIEKGGTVLHSFVRKTKPGMNEIKFTATEQMVPNIYCSVSIIQPHNHAGNDMPIRMYGIVPVKVENPKSKLEPQITTASRWEPDSDVQLTVAEAGGRPMAYTIDIVDEGLLDLTNFKTPSPYDAFNAKEALKIMTWDVYDYILDAFDGDENRILAIGGDEELAKRQDKANHANRFKPVVVHLGPFTLKKGQKATHKFHFPNYIGSVRAMVVAVGDKAYGSNDVTVPVRKPLMVQPTLPRVLGTGESLMIPVTVFAMEKGISKATVTIREKDGLAVFPQGNSKTVHFDKPGDRIVYFPVKIKDVEGVTHFTVNASSGAYAASDEIEIEVRNPNPYISEVAGFNLPKGQSLSQNVNPLGVYGSNTVAIEVSSIPPIDLSNRLAYLIRYPHGCVEQTTSSVFPQLYVESIQESDENMRKKIATNIQSGIKRLQQFQTSDGGFAYWPGMGSSSPWGSTYAGHFLVEAKKKGYAVPDEMMDDWLRYQTDRANEWSPGDSHYGFAEKDQAYRLLTLALAGKPARSAMNRLRKKGDLPNLAAWLLAHAYALTGKKDVAKQIVAKADTQFKPYRELSWSYGSDVRDRAVALMSLTAIGDQSRAFNLLKELSEKLSSSDWLSTQSTAMALMAVSSYHEQYKPGDLNFAYSIGSQSGTVTSGKPVKTITVKNPNKPQQISIRNKTNGPLFVRLIRRGKPAIGQEPARNARDLNMTVTYTSLDGQPIDVSSLPRGKEFLAVVTVTNPGTRLSNYENMALTQIFPSGWEISNYRLNEDAALDDISPFDYQDIRDDRVFTYFNVRRGENVTYKFLITAAYPGRYYLPGTYCEAMYDASIHAGTRGRWVNVAAN